MKTLTTSFLLLSISLGLPAQSHCWDTGTYAFGLLEPSDLKGYCRVEIRESIRRRFSQTKPVFLAEVMLDTNGNAIAYNGVDPLTGSSDHRSWVYDSAGRLVKILVAADSAGHPFELKATFTYSGNHVVHQRTDFHHYSKYEWFAWGDGGHLTRHLSGLQDTTAESCDIQHEYRYDSLGRMTANITWVNGVRITRKLAYFDNIVRATCTEEGSRSAVIEEFVLNAQGLPQSAATFKEGSKKRRPCTLRTFTYYP